MTYQFNNLKDAFKEVETWLAKEFSQIHTGKASPILLDSITIDSYGAQMPVKNVASVTIEDPRTLRIAPWDKTQIKAIEKSIIDANIGLSVVSDSDGLRAIFPMMTGENRAKLVKVLKELLEEARIRVRKEREIVQNDIRDKQKDGEMTEDEAFKGKEELQKHVDTANGTLEAMFAKKENDIMTV